MKAIDLVLREMETLGLGALVRDVRRSISAEACGAISDKMPTLGQYREALRTAEERIADEIHDFTANPRHLTPEDVLIYSTRPLSWAVAEMMRAERARMLSPELASKVDP